MKKWEIFLNRMSNIKMNKNNGMTNSKLHPKKKNLSEMIVYIIKTKIIFKKYLNYIFRNSLMRLNLSYKTLPLPFIFMSL